jgi:hypothetical protein
MDRNPGKAKNVTDWEKEERLKKAMVEIIQQIQKHKPKHKGHPHPWRDGTQLGRVCKILFL